MSGSTNQAGGTAPAGSGGEYRPIWMPTPESIQHSNLANWMRERGIPDYAAFYRWSIEQRGQFWQAAMERLGIQFAVPPIAILEMERGPELANWCPGARLNIAESCFQAGEDELALVAGRPGQSLSRWTQGELRRAANRVANGLVEAGFKPGDPIGVFMPMTDWSVAIYLGIVLAGCQVVSIADSFAAPEIATRLRIAGARAVLTYEIQHRAGKTIPLYQRLVEATDVPAIVLPAEDQPVQLMRDQDLDWVDFLSDREAFQPVISDAGATLNILFSSGTTGEPKAIPWTQLTPIRCAVDGYCHQDIRPGDVCAWPSNLGWMMGPWLIFASLINRAAIALFEDVPTGPAFGQFVQDAKVTMLGVVPTLVKAWQASGDLDSYDWSAIRVFSSTGESSQADAMTYLSSLAGGKPIIEYCGGTEVGGGYVSSVVLRPNVAAAFNTPTVGLEFVLLEADADTESGFRESDQGEVFLIPPSIGLSQRLLNRDHHETYFAGTPEIESRGPLRRHGDHFRRVQTDWGELYIAGGRVDDTMNLGGIKVSSAEIERVLNQAPGVLETAAVAVTAATGPDQLAVFAVREASSGRAPGTGTEEERKQLNQLLKTQLNPLFRITSLEWVASLPRTASGKVMRRKLRS